MAKSTVNENDKWPIPDDWTEDDGYQLVAFCVPNSRGWRSIVRGQVSSLAYGRNWNKFSGTITDAQDIAREVYETMGFVCMDDLIVAIECVCEQVTKGVEKGQAEGTDVDVPPSNGSVTVGLGQQFENQTQYFNAKCNAANAIYDTVLGAAGWLDDNVDNVLLGVFGGLTTGLLVGLTAAGPLGWAVQLASSTIASLSGFILAYVLNFGDIFDALGEQHEDLVEALHNAGDTGMARDVFISILGDAATTTTAIEQDFVGALLTNSLLNTLFDMSDDIASYQSPDPVACGSILAQWTFDVDGDGFVFEDQSDSGYSATGEWSSPNEAWKIEVTGTGTTTSFRGRGAIAKSGLSIPVGIGNSIRVDTSETSDGVGFTTYIKIIYSDLTEQEQSFGGQAGATTNVMNIEKTATIETVEFAMSRSWSQSFVAFRYVEEITVY